VRRVLIDTGPLVALCDGDNGLHARALEELDVIHGPVLVGLPALTEAHFLLSAAHLRSRLAGLVAREVLTVGAPKDAGRVHSRALAWLERYGEHRPDFADAYLVAWAESEPDARVWTFDREFAQVWRTLGGKKVALAVR
jgi:predicted nucleic acid-binding protein